MDKLLAKSVDKQLLTPSRSASRSNVRQVHTQHQYYHEMKDKFDQACDSLVNLDLAVAYDAGNAGSLLKYDKE